MLRVIGQDDGEREPPRFLATRKRVGWGEGLHTPEPGHHPARWLTAQGELTLPAVADPAFLELTVFSPWHDLSQELSVALAGGDRVFGLPDGWSRLSVALPEGLERLRLAVNKTLPPALHPRDERDLGVLIRDAWVHSDAVRHSFVVRQYRNAAHNLLEMVDGRAVLGSTPPRLELAAATLPQVASTGEAADGDGFFEGAACVQGTLGDPAEAGSVERLVAIAEERGKTLEIDVAAGWLDDRLAERLAGRDLDLQLAFDPAADRRGPRELGSELAAWLDRLERKCEGAGGTVPRITLSIAPPPAADVAALSAVAALCRRGSLDRVVLAVPRDGAARRSAGRRARAELAEACARHGVELVDELGAGQAGPGAPCDSLAGAPAGVAGRRAPGADGDLGAARLPLCRQPWHTMRVEERGVLPCRFGGRAVASPADYREAWNSPALREIRRELAAGRFPHYCLGSPRCPVVSRSAAAGRMSLGQLASVRLRRVWEWLDQVGQGLPSRFFRPLKRMALALARPLL